MMFIADINSKTVLFCVSYHHIMVVIMATNFVLLFIFTSLMCYEVYLVDMHMHLKVCD